MATTNRILARSKPAAATPTTLYTVPSATQANVNLFIANQSSSDDAIRVAVTPSGSSLAATDYIFYGKELTGNNTINVTGIALNTGDFMTIYSTTGNTSFVATGITII